MDIKRIFFEIDFIERYKVLSEKYNNIDDAMEIFSIDTVIDIFHEIGYEPKYFKKENFFRISNKIDNYEVWLHIGLKHGIVELMIYIKTGSDFLSPCGPFSWISDEMGISQDQRIMAPIFSNYEDLKNILKDALDIFNDLRERFRQIIFSTS